MPTVVQQKQATALTTPVLRFSAIVAAFNPILNLTLHDSPFLIDAAILGAYGTKAVRNAMAEGIDQIVLHPPIRLSPPYCDDHARVHCNTDILALRSQFSLSL